MIRAKSEAAKPGCTGVHIRQKTGLAAKPPVRVTGFPEQQEETGIKPSVLRVSGAEIFRVGTRP